MDGQAPGYIDVADTDLIMARTYASGMFESYNLSFPAVMPGFDDGYELVRFRAQTIGKFPRHEMPVIEEEDLDTLKASLDMIRVRDRLEAFCDVCSVTADEIKPLQKQIYLDKSIPNIAVKGIAETMQFLSSRHLLLSAESFLIDGHHTWLTGSLFSTNFRFPALRTRVPLNILLPLVLELTVSLGHRRNM